MMAARAHSVARRSSLVAPLALAAALSAGMLACSGAATGAEAPPATASSAATKAPVAEQSHGVVKVFADALSEVALRADQRAIVEKLAQETEARHAPLTKARAEIATTLAAQIEANAIDTGALQPKFDAATAAAEAAQQGDRDALQKLHDVLDATQRAAFVDALRASFHGGHRGPEGGMRPADWARELALTGDQQTRIRDLLMEQHKAHEGEAKARPDLASHDHARGKGGPAEPGEFLEAFKGDAFAIDAVSPKRDVRVEGRGMSEHVVAVVKTILPELTVEQRGKAASMVRAYVADEHAPGL